MPSTQRDPGGQQTVVVTPVDDVKMHTWSDGQHTPFTQTVPEGQQISPLAVLHDSTGCPSALTQVQRPSRHFWPRGQQMPLQGGAPVFSQRQAPLTHFVPGGQHLWTGTVPVVEVHTCPVGQHTPLTQTLPTGQHTSP